MILCNIVTLFIFFSMWGYISSNTPQKLPKYGLHFHPATLPREKRIGILALKMRVKGKFFLCFILFIFFFLLHFFFLKGERKIF